MGKNRYSIRNGVNQCGKRNLFGILKLKKSNSFMLVLIGGLAMPMLINVADLASKDKHRTFGSYAYNVEGISFLLLYGVLFSIIAGYIFCREYSDKTASTLYSYPCNRIKIFIGKLIVIYALIFLVCFIQCVSVYLGYYKLYGVLEKELIIKDIKANIIAVLFQMALVPIPIFLANFGKNIILPMVYGILNLCVQGMMGNSDFIYAKYNPLLGSYFSIKYLYYEDISNIKCTVVVAIIFFIISMIMCVYQYSKTDMI